MFTKTDRNYDMKTTPETTSVAATSSHTPAQSPARATKGPSVISAELKVVGNLICSGDVQIDGAVEGDVESRTVTIGEGAKVKGGTSAETVIICGEINGAVRGTSVRIARSARVTGDVTYKSLSIEEGAVLNGNCIHDGKVDTSGAAHKRGDSGHVANVYTTAKATG
ncbi:MAG TPA: polymer-forming cytoskeletal protein [Alphaproteobacteria bacterium]|nr:polymer-forming cytoskeletal protein [Alphaproteobacteria bacterium]